VQTKKSKELLNMIINSAIPSPTKEASPQVKTQIPSHPRSQQHSPKSSKRRSTWVRKNENIENTFMEFFN